MSDDTPQPVTVEALLASVLTLAVESWRVRRIFEKVVGKLDPLARPRYQSQFRWFEKKVEGALADAGLYMINLEGQSFDSGTAATPLNLEDFTSTDTLVIDQMLEPIIMGPNGLVKTGTVILRKAEL